MCNVGYLRAEVSVEIAQIVLILEQVDRVLIHRTLSTSSAARATLYERESARFKSAMRSCEPCTEPSLGQVQCRSA